MRSRPMAVGEIEFQNPVQVLLAQDNHAIETLSAYGPQVRRDRRQFSAMGAWPTPPLSAMEATRIGFWLGTPSRAQDSSGTTNAGAGYRGCSGIIS
jgi:hypothetical protein